jgi:IgGFc binding protein
MNFASSGDGGIVLEDGGAEPDDATGGPVCAYGQIVCAGTTAKTCDGQGGFSDEKQCPADCKDGRGCVDCVPKSGACDPETKMATLCDVTGTREIVFECDGENMECKPDGCHGPCAPESLGTSNVGCEFLPTVTANNVWGNRNAGGFRFGILLGNVAGKVTTVDIGDTIAGSPRSQKVTLMPGEVHAVPLDWVLELKGPDWTTPYDAVAPTQSVKKIAGAYRVRSNLPIVAYQFSAQKPAIDDETGACPKMTTGETGCYAHSVDASLLLPTHALSSNYVVAGYHSWHRDGYSDAGTPSPLNMGDFIAITAVRNGTDVTIKLRPNQSVLTWPDLPVLMPGAVVNVAMSAGQVVELFSDGTSESETFSGSTITTATRDRKGDRPPPIQLLTGVGCIGMPWGAPCSHVEDGVLPLDVLGNEYVLTTISRPETPATYTARIQATENHTVLTFDPSSVYNSVTINKGEVLELTDIAEDLKVSSSAPIGITQYVNTDAPGDAAGPTSALRVGGTNALTVVPVVHYRMAHTFAASPDFGLNFVSIVAPTGSTVKLDGKSIPAKSFRAVGASGRSVAQMPLSATSNAKVHEVEGDKPIGIVVYGFGPYAGYLYPGGLDLRPNVPTSAGVH